MRDIEREYCNWQYYSEIVIISQCYSVLCMPTIRIGKKTAEAINELGGTFDKPDDVIQRLIEEAGHGEQLKETEASSKNMNSGSKKRGSRQDWIDSWVDQVEQKVAAQGIEFKRFPGRGGEDFIINGAYIGKVRTTEAWDREDERIWLRFEDEIGWAEDHSEMDAIAIVLDMYDPNSPFTDQDHFFVLDQGMLRNDTSSAGNRELDVYGPGRYESPFDRYADDWEEWY